MRVTLWDPDDYGRNATAQTAWAAGLLPLLALSGNEAILDLGSGDGRVTAGLARLVPEGYVVGLDASPSMTAHARRNHATVQPNLEFVLGDMEAIPFRDRFDRVFSNAALHWACDHAAVAGGIARALRHGGRAVIQCGGKGNAAAMVTVLDDLIRSPSWAPYFSDTTFRYTFPDDATFRAHLMKAGLVPFEVRLIPITMTVAERDGLAGWIRTTWLRYTGSVPDNRREAFVQALVDGYLARLPPGRDGAIEVAMVRLQAVAERT
ncbi:MAG: methyltransferase domain-containing protein [Methanospirillum sp.]|nr:methyltransferase domain-containing protein [Methanospirillum sp.]